MHNDAPLARRRAALQAACAEQRAALGYFANELTEPISGDGLLGRVLRGGRTPLILGGVALGFLLTRPRKLVPLLTGAYGLWQVAQPVIETVRQARSAAAASGDDT